MPAIKPHNTATTDASWSVADQEKKLKSPISGAEAQAFYAWYEEGAPDPDNDGWPDFKNAYKFGHHMVGDSGIGGAANMTACSSGIAVLNGARGGSSIPSDDKQGVYDHLARHLTAGGKTPPPLGASAEETDAWAAAVERDEAAALERAAGRAEEGLPPLLPLGQRTWAIDPSVMPQIAQAYRTGRNAPAAVAELAQLSPEAGVRMFPAAAGGAQKRITGGVAVVPLCGVITPRGSLLSMLFGGGRSGLKGFAEGFQEAIASPDIGAVVLDIDSPGGLVSLVPETAAMIAAARGEKPIIAVANTMCASAAYWIGSQADEIVCTPSGIVGSIGVYMLHENWSAWNEKAGVEPTYIKAGRYKAEGNENEPLGDAATAAWQGECDDIYAMFLDAVAEGRGTTSAAVKGGYGEGRCLRAQRALEAGMCDRVGTVGDVISELLGVAGSSEGGLQGRLSGRALAAADVPDEDEEEDDLDDDEDDEDDKPEVDADARRRRAELLFG